MTGCDDDHCPPGRLRGQDQNVTFGSPRHRGCEGGEQCGIAFSQLIHAVQHDFRGHDPLIQAMALHYHFAAMHPFLDGNGRTARAMEALLLQRAGLRDAAFIAMSNYYYEEKPGYLAALAQARSQGYDLTPFLSFGLRGIAVQCGRLFQEITHNVRKVVFRTMMVDLFPRLRTPRKRVIAERQIEILKLLLEVERIGLAELMRKTDEFYRKLKNPSRALFRDLHALVHLQAMRAQESANEPGRYRFEINLDWPAQMTESDFLEKVRQLPKAKSHSFL